MVGAVSRNDLCPCGSGLKFKKCCGAEGAGPSGTDLRAVPLIGKPARADVATIHKRAMDHFNAKRVSAAIADFLEIVRLHPESADAHHDLGTALFADGQLAAAAPALERAVLLRPSFEAALGKLASVLEQLGRETEAGATYGRLARVTRDGIQKRLFTSKAFSLAGAIDDAEAELRRALAGAPSNPGANVLLGQLLLERGAFEDAEAHLVQSLDTFPDVFQHVTASRRMREEDRPLVQRASALAERPDLRMLQRSAVHFGLGKAHDDLREYEEAMRHYDAANAMRARPAPLNRSSLAEQYDRSIAAYPRARLPAECPADRLGGPDDELPILILGMPRSGTTLVEQIVSSHPDVAAGGELPFWRDRVKSWMDAANAIVVEPTRAALVSDPLREFLAARPVRSLAEKISRVQPVQSTQASTDVDPDRLREAARDFTALLRTIGPTAARVTDKAPFNFERIGLIRSALPSVRIIHCRRQPVDTCLSIYFTNYKGRQAWSRSDLLFQYRQYERVMAHWRSVLSPNRFTEVDYEAVIADREGETRRLVAFLGLPWDDACLAHERNTRLVKSASLWQARQPTYTRSLDRWRAYEPWLGELRELLAPTDRQE